MKKGNKNFVLAVAVLLGIFGAIALTANKDSPYFWLELAADIGLVVACFVLIRDREYWDAIFGVLATVCTVCAIATVGKLADPATRSYFLGALAFGALFVMLARGRRGVLGGIFLIVGIPIVLLGLVYGVYYLATGNRL